MSQETSGFAALILPTTKEWKWANAIKIIGRQKEAECAVP